MATSSCSQIPPRTNRLLLLCHSAMNITEIIRRFPMAFFDFSNLTRKGGQSATVKNISIFDALNAKAPVSLFSAISPQKVFQLTEKALFCERHY